MCGENSVLRGVNSLLIGSPPHVRGKRSCLGEINFCTRITPACAGKTLWLIDLLKQLRDHPRMCGENLVTLVIKATLLGSPPHVRGKPNTPVDANNHARITPACAGKTFVTRI